MEGTPSPTLVTELERKFICVTLPPRQARNLPAAVPAEQKPGRGVSAGWGGGCGEGKQKQPCV